MRARLGATVGLLGLVALLALGACGAPGPRAPTTPRGLSAHPEDAAVTLEWGSNPEPDLAAYVMSVTLESGALLTTERVPASETTTTITELENGVTYGFSLQAESSSGARSAPTAPVFATPQAGTAPPTTPRNLAAAAQSGQVLLTWDRNPEADLAGYVLHHGVAPGPLAQRTELPPTAFSTVITGLENGTTYAFALEARNDQGATSPRTATVAATPQANLAAPLVRGVSIAGYGDSTQVRQGAGPIEVRLAGERLDMLEAARVLGAFDLTVLEANATSARLTGFVPHGLELGARTLVVTAAGGEFAVHDAIEVTKITAAKTPGLNPSDTTGVGTPNRPFLTLSMALSVAGAGDTVLLGAGTYGPGEAWPTGGVQPAANVPGGVRIEGQSSDRGAVVLRGPNDGRTDGLAFTASGELRNVSLTGFRYAITHLGGVDEGRQAGSLAIENVAAFDNMTGLWATALDTLTVTDAAFRNNARGDNSGYGLLVQGTRLVTIATAEVIGNRVGLRLTTPGASYPSGASLTGLLVSTNGGHGIHVTGVSTSLRDSQVASNTGDGLRIDGAPRSLSLERGTVLQGNTGFQLHDARPAYQGTFHVDRDALPGSGITGGVAIWPDKLDNYYLIDNAGNGFLFG